MRIKSSIFSMTCRCFQAWLACWAKLALGRVPGSSHITTLWLYSQHKTLSVTRPALWASQQPSLKYLQTYEFPLFRVLQCQWIQTSPRRIKQISWICERAGNCVVPGPVQATQHQAYITTSQAYVTITHIALLCQYTRHCS